MDQEQVLIQEGWTSRQKTILFVFFVLVFIIGIFILFFLPKIKPHYDPVPVYQTIGLPSARQFQFTISPNDQWIVYLDEVYPYYDRHNLVVYNIPNDQKQTIVINEQDSQLLKFGLKNQCWTPDSRYCILENEINGYLDFSGPEPKFVAGKKDHQGLTCSDCELTDNPSYFDIPKDRFISPDGRFTAEAVSYGTGFVSPPKLYVTDTQSNSKVFVADNVYYDMHFTSDSKRLYYYGCKYGGACDKYKDHLFYIDLSDDSPHRSLEPYDKNIDPGIYYSQHSEEEEAVALEQIYKKENAEKEAMLRAHYDLFVEKFKKPQKIVGLQSDRLVTSDYYELALHWNDVLPDKVSVELGDFVATLIGQEVTVVMPTYEEFKKDYDGAYKFDLWVGEDLYIHDGDGKEIMTVPRPTDPKYKKYIGIVRAKVYYNGELLNTKFK